MKLSALFLTTALLTTGCVSITNSPSNNNSAPAASAANSNSANALKDDLDELGMVITLPYEPIDGKWREDEFAKAAGTGKKLTAVLRFSKEAAEKLATQAAKYRPPTPEVINSETWFPEELVAQSQTSGDETLKGTTMGANDFYNPPYADGKLTRIESTDYFILELYSK